MKTTSLNPPSAEPGGFFPRGVGWYRHHFQAPAAWSGKKVSVEFEGVYENAGLFLAALMSLK